MRLKSLQNRGPFKDSNSVRASEVGLTLVELMVVVAVIGILATIGVPKYETYVARARATEQKVLLSSAGVALRSFFASEGTYTMCLKEAGFELPPGAKRWFTVGFGPGFVPNRCGPKGIYFLQ